MLPAGIGAEYKQQELNAEANTVATQTYTVNGITYDTASGRPINPETGNYLLNERRSSAQLNSRRKPSQTLRYPNAQITDNTDYLEIKVVEYVPTGNPSNFDFSQPTIPTEDSRAQYGSSNSVFNVKRSSDNYSSNREKTLGTVLLPIPQSVMDNRGVDWGAKQLNGFAAAAVAAGMAGIQSDTFIGGADKLLKGGSNAVSSLFKEGGVSQDAASAFFAGQAVNVFGNNVNPQELITRTTGQIINQNLELLFKGVELRQFSFKFDLAPRDITESNTIKQIVRLFKQNMSAKKNGANNAGGLFLSSPNIFKLCYKTGGKKHAYLNSFFPMAMKKITMNYSGAGRFATYEDTTPVTMQMEISLQEINPIYNEDYDIGDGTIGVGY
jgi:hypothetical protein